MRYFFILALIFSTQGLLAQIFLEADPITPFEPIQSGMVAFGDIDGDDDNDLFISGFTTFYVYSVNLYINDGAGNFSVASGLPFEPLQSGDVALEDIDNDGDLDLLMSGVAFGNELSIHLYTNDGQGNFTEVADIPFDKVRNGSVAFADIDGDNDADVLITGLADEFVRIAKLYINDGTGQFSEVLDTPFEGVHWSDVEFADVNGDDDPDLLITGGDLGLLVAELYINDGLGNFTLVEDTPFPGVRRGAVAFGDIDGDEDLDVLISGRDGIFDPTTRLFTNDGLGNFTEIEDTPFAGVEYGDNAIEDVDLDGDNDIIISGSTSKNNPFKKETKLYLNDGTGNFTEYMEDQFEGVDFSTISFADVNGDEIKDLLITGENIFDPTTRLFINQSGVSSVAESISSGSNFTLYPNPTSGHAVTMVISGKQNKTCNLKLKSLNGQLIKQQQISIFTEVQQTQFELPSLGAGAYLLQLQDGMQISRELLIIH